MIQLGDEESEIFASLSKRVETRIDAADSVFAAHGLTQGKLHLNEVNTRYSSEEGVQIHFVDATTIPFDFRATARTMWRHMGSNDLKLQSHRVSVSVPVKHAICAIWFCVETKHPTDAVCFQNVRRTQQTLIMEQTEDTLVVKRLLTPNAARDEVYPTTIRSVCKRVVQEHRVLMVWESIIEHKRSQVDQKLDIQLVHQGWSQILHIVADDGSVASTIQSYGRMSPTVLEIPQSDNTPPQKKQQQRDIGFLTKTIIASYQQNMHNVHQAIENELMEEFLSKAR